MFIVSSKNRLSKTWLIFVQQSFFGFILVSDNFIDGLDIGQAFRQT